MTTPAYTPLGSSGLAAQPIDFGNPTTPTTPPVKAPTGQTSTATPPATPTTPPAKPSAIVSSQPAAAQIPKIQAAVTQGQTDIATGNANRAATGGALPGSNSANAGKPGYDVFGNAVQGTPLPNGGATAPTPEDTIANTPDTGNQWAYDASGNRVQVPIGNVPPGYASSNPTAAPTLPVTDTVTDPVGNTYKQYSDGTYGKFDATGAYQGQASSQDFQTNKDGQGLLTSLNQVINGTYPLSPTQQAQVDGLKAQFATLIQQQTTANANFTGGTTVAENLYGMGNSLTGLGEIKGTVDAGIAKIADLNSKLTSAVATMEQGFQTDDLTMLKSAYDMYTTSVKDKQDELDKLTAASQKALVDSQNNARDNETLQLTAMMDDNTISYQVKQQALAQSSLDEKTKDDIATQQLEKLKYNLSVQSENFKESTTPNLNNGLGDGSQLPATQMTQSGLPDAAGQAQLLNSLPGGPNGDLATQVKGLANYSLSPTDFTVRGLKGGVQYTRDQMVALATKYDPTYSDAQFPTRQAYLKSLQPGGAVGQKLVALNTASAHIATLANDVSQLGNANFAPYNYAKNTVLPIFGLGSTAGAKLDVGGVTGELATAFKAAGATDTEIKSLGTIDTNSTPADIQSYVTSATELLAGKLGAQTDGYVQTMGKAPSQPLLSPTATAALSTLKNQGYTIKVPGVDYTDPAAYIKSDPNAQANMDKARQQLQALNLPVTPENILQGAQNLQ